MIGLILKGVFTKVSFDLNCLGASSYPWEFVKKEEEKIIFFKPNTRISYQLRSPPTPPGLRSGF